MASRLITRSVLGAVGATVIGTTVIAATTIAADAASALPVIPVPPPAQVVNIESDADLDDSTTPGGDVYYAITSPRDADHGFGWRLRIDVRVKNTGLGAISVASITVDTDETSPQDVALDDPVTINPGASKSVLVPADIGVSDGDGPTSLTLQVHLAGYQTPVFGSADLVAFESSTPSHGYRFPARRNDLPVGTFWYAGSHANTATQRYAYDFGARRWDAAADAWTGYTATAVANAAGGGPALGTQNAQWIIWNTPVYAIADATIVRCHRSIADNVPGSSTPGGGNSIILDLGDGTYAAYYHLKQGTVPAALCPIEGDVGGNQIPLAIPVVAGQFLGRVGNSGHSSGPHLHFQIMDSPYHDDGAQRGLPARFTGIQTHVLSGYDPETDASGWYVHAAGESSVPINRLVLPPCGGPACAFAPAP